MLADEPWPEAASNGATAGGVVFALLGKPAVTPGDATSSFFALIVITTRKPTSLRRTPGLCQSLMAERQFMAEALHDPPRTTCP